MNWKLAIPVLILVIAGAVFWMLATGPDSGIGTGSETSQSAEDEKSRLGSGSTANPDLAAKDDDVKSDPDTPEETIPEGPLLLEGKVFGEGTPIPGARVLLFSVAEIEKLIEKMQLLAPTSGALPNVPQIVNSVKSQLNAFRQTAIMCTTDNDGTFELREASEGGYIILTYAQGWLFEYGDVVSLSIDRPSFVQVDLDRGATIAGRVVGNSSEGVSGIKVIAEYRPPGSPPLGRIVRRGLRLLNGEFLKGPFERATDSTGKFEIDGLPPGSYDLTAYDERGLETTVANVETGSTSTVIFFGDGGSISGQLVDTSQIPRPGIKISLERMEEVIQLPFPASNFSQIANVVNGYLKDRPIETVSRDDGSFSFSPLGEGRYRMFIDTPGYFPLSQEVSIAWGEQKVLDVVEINAGQAFTGVVRDAQGLPLAGATVLANSTNMDFMTMGGLMKDFLTQRLSTTTEADGTFVLSGVKSGKYNVVASFGEYAADVAGGVSPGEGDLEFTLIPGQTISGRVVSKETQEGIASASVRVGENVVMTDSEGEFELRGVVAGGRPAAELAFGGGRMRRFREAEAGEDPSVQLRINAKGYRNDRRSILIDPALEPILVELETAPAITGTVFSPDGEPAAGALIRLCPAFPDEMTQLGFMDPSLIFLAVTVTDLEGQFRIDEYQGIPGRFQVLADHLQHARGYSERFSLNDAEGQDIDVRVDLIPGAIVKGVVTDGGRPIAGAAVRMSQQREEMGMQERMIMNMIGLPKGGDVMHTNLDGEYEFTKVLPGDYQVSSEMVGYTESPPQSFTLGEGQTVEMSITLTPGGTLTGTVVDFSGAPLAGARVRLLRSSEDSGMMEAQRFLGGAYKSTSTDASGAYEMTGIANGIYVVVAEKDSFSPVEVENVVPGQIMPVLSLIPAAELRGFVVDNTTGSPVPEFEVRVSLEGESDWRSQMSRNISSSEGSFEQKNLEAGRYVVSISAAGYLETEAKIELSPGIAQAEDFGLTRAGVLRGYITDPDGRPVEGASVWFEIPEPKSEAKSDEERIRSSFRRRMGDNVVSDVEGYFYLDTLPDKSVTIMVSHDDFQQFSKADVQVGLGETIDADFQLDPGLTVSGVLLDERGQPLSDQWFFLLPEGGSGGQKWENTDDDGRFSLSGLSPGKYKLVTPGRRGANQGSTSIDLSNGRDLDDLRLKLEPEAESKDD